MTEKEKVKETEKRRGSFYEPKEVLIFQSTGTYIGRMCSVRAISMHARLAPQTISRVCSGERIVAKDHYYRFLHPDIEVDDSDYRTLTVEEYDKMCDFKGEYLTPEDRKTRKRATTNSKQQKLDNDE